MNVSLEHNISQNIFLQKRSNKKVNFHVSFTKYRLDLLHETNTYVPKNSNGKIKFCFADLHRDLKIKFSDNKNIGYDSFESFLEALDEKLGNWEKDNNLTMTENVKVMNKSMSKSGFFTCLYRFRFIVFLMVLLIKYISYLHFSQNR